MSALLISCGGKNEKKDGSTEIATSESDCSIDQLNFSANIIDIIDEDDEFITKDIKKNDEKDLFTGVGVEKDQNDSIITKIEVKNGWLMRYIHRIKKDNKYITILDYTFDNGRIQDGFKMFTNNQLNGTRTTSTGAGLTGVSVPGYDFINQLIRYKNGKSKPEWEVSLFPNHKANLNPVYDEGGTRISSEEIIGLGLSYTNTLNLKQTLTGFTKINEEDDCIWKFDNMSTYIFVDGNNQTIENTLKNLKKEVKGFDYWEE